MTIAKRREKDSQAGLVSAPSAATAGAAAGPADPTIGDDLLRDAVVDASESVADLIEQQHANGRGDAREDRVLDEVLPVRATNQAADEGCESTCVCELRVKRETSAGLFRLVWAQVIFDNLNLRWQHELPLLGLAAHRLSALGRRNGGSMGFVDHDRLSYTQREAIFHVPPHQVAFNLVSTVGHHGLQPPQKH